MSIYTVGYVFADEATPRDEYFATVNASNAEEAEADVVTKMYLAGDRVMTTGVMTKA